MNAGQLLLSPIHWTLAQSHSCDSGLLVPPSVRWPHPKTPRQDRKMWGETLSFVPDASDHTDDGEHIYLN